MTPQQIEAFVDASAVALELHIAAEYRAGVLRYFALAADMAALVDGLRLTVADESGNVFLPVEPGGDA
jgi:hypothetical protein